MNDFVNYLNNIPFQKQIEIVKESKEFKDTGLLPDGALKAAAKGLGELSDNSPLYFVEVVIKEVTLQVALKYIKLIGA